MKPTLSVLATLIILFSSSCAFSEEYSRAELKNKLDGFSRMYSAGTGMLIGGIVLDVIGPTLLINGISVFAKYMDNLDSDSTYDEFEFPDGLGQIYAGAICLGFGVPLTIAGSVLKSIGGSKSREYRSRLKNLSLDFAPNKVSLTYRF